MHCIWLERTILTQRGGGGESEKGIPTHHARVGTTEKEKYNYRTAAIERVHLGEDGTEGRLTDGRRIDHGGGSVGFILCRTHSMGIGVGMDMKHTDECPPSSKPRSSSPPYSLVMRVKSGLAVSLILS